MSKSETSSNSEILKTDDLETMSCQALSDSPAQSEKSYQKPVVKKLGSLKELTQFGGSGSADFFGQRA